MARTVAPSRTRGYSRYTYDLYVCSQSKVELQRERTDVDYKFSRITNRL